MRLTALSATAQVDHARSMLPKDIMVLHCPQDDSWFRDTGPIVRT